MDKEQPLFRPEALAEQRTDWLGKVVLVTPPSAKMFGLLAAFIVLAFGSLLVFASFTSKVRVNGWLVAEQGQARIVAPIDGVVTNLAVAEGARIDAGDHLVTVNAEQRSTSIGATRAEVSRLLTKRRESLEREVMQQRKLLSRRADGLRSRIDAMEAEIGELDKEIEVQSSRAGLADKASARLRRLRKRGYVSLAQTQLQQEQALEQRGRLQSLVRERAERNRELVALQAELSELPLQSELGIAELNRAADELDQAIAQTEAQRELVLAAPQSGFVTGLQVSDGSAVRAGLSMMSIVPGDAEIVAHLFGTSRSIGFVRPGQQVKLSYDAFPYQKFGHHLGTITAVSRSAMSAADLPPGLAGLSDLISETEPIYRIVVAVDRQEVMAYGESYPLQPGMRLAADVLIERRRLYEWVLDPLYTLTGRL